MTIDHRIVSIWTARIWPAVVLSVIGYASYAFIKPVCVDYILQDRERTITTGCLIAGFGLLLLFVTTTYLRIISTLATDPGYVSRSKQYKKTKESRRQHRGRKSIRGHNRKSSNTDGNKEKLGGGNPVIGVPYTESIQSQRPPPDTQQPGLGYFYNKEVFICEGDGRPPWCTKCMEWKPDRTHHCSEVERCVRKMDHFCPWVGGIVSETNFKFFFQFVTWTCLLCLYILVTVAACMPEYRKSPNRKHLAHWSALIGLAGFFFLFTAGMVFTTSKNILLNSTSVEDLSRTVKKWSLAVHLPNPPPSSQPRPYQTITFPGHSASAAHGTSQRTFAILYSQPGDNPFDLGPYNNFTSVMGYRPWDWILPLKHSPCCNHGGESDWPLGPVYDKMRKEAGLGER